MAPGAHPGYPPPGAYPGYRAYPAPPPVAPGGQRLADFGPRLVARLIDGVLLGMVQLAVALSGFIIVFAQYFAVLEVDANGDPVVPRFSDLVLPWLLLYAGIFVLALLLSYLYEVEVLLRRGGRSVGKQVMRLRVAPLDPAATLDRRTLTRRWLVSGPAAMFLPGFAYVDGLWQLGDRPYRQCLHDKFAHTIVIKDAP